MFWTVGLWIAVALALGLLVGLYAVGAGWLEPAEIPRSQIALAWFGSLLVPGLTAVVATAWIAAQAATKTIADVEMALRDLRPESLDSDSTDLPEDIVELGLPALRAELTAARARMAEALNAQERFIANVSHEFRTPIAVILTETDVLLHRRRDLPEEVREYAESVQEEMLRLKQMVDGFLLLIQIEHGKRRRPRRRVYVCDELLDVVSGLQAFAEPYSVKIRLDFGVDPDLDAFIVLGDSALFRQMVSNLIRNAVRFSPRDQDVNVTVALDTTDVGKNAIEVSVRDRGPGIPEQMVDHIFERFVQAPTEHQRGRGTGLGLEIAQSVAELHRGKISAANNPDGGCKFAVRIPQYVLKTETTAKPDGQSAT